MTNNNEGKQMKYKNGVYDISNEDYHASEGVSRSALWLFNQSPIHYWHKYLNAERKPDKFNPNFLIGEMVHCLMLEHDQYHYRYVTEETYTPLPPPLTIKEFGRERSEQRKRDRERVIKQNKDNKALFEKETAHMTVITEEQHMKAVAMYHSSHTDIMAQKLFNLADTEKSIYFTHEPSGLQVKVRPDAWKGTIVTDLKTVKSGVYRDFQNSAHQYGYFLQAAMIKAALKSIDVDMESFVFYCIEKVEPYACTYYIVDNDALEYGTNQFNHMMQRFADCKQKNKWQSYAPQTLSIPNYALKEFNNV